MSTTTGNAVTAPLGLIFTLNDGFVTRALDGLTLDDLWHRPSEHTNPMFWLLGHIVHTRGAALRIVGEDYRTGWGDRFQRGASLRERSDYPSLADIERVRAETGARLAARLPVMTDAELAAEATGHRLPGCRTVADQIGFLGLHESYHVGQLSYVRKLLGHSSIIG
jgi:hypothetical protein